MEKCGFCNGVYKEGENWVQCLECNVWYHVACDLNGEEPFFRCVQCYIEDSE